MQTHQNDTSFVGTNSLDPLQWVTNHADYLCNYVITRINDKEAAMDLVQETFLAALKKIEKFEGRSSDTAILKNKILDVYRKKSAEHIKETEGQANEEAFFDAADGHWKTKHQPKVLAFKNTIL